MGVPTKAEAQSIVRNNAYYSKMLKQGRKNELLFPSNAVDYEMAGQVLDQELPQRRESEFPDGGLINQVRKVDSLVKDELKNYSKGRVPTRKGGK